MSAYSSRVRVRISTQSSAGHSQRNGSCSMSAPSRSACSWIASFAPRKRSLFAWILCSRVPLSIPWFLGPARRRETLDVRSELRGSGLARLDLANELVELHAVRAGSPPNQIERSVGLEAVPLREDALGLLDRDPRLKGVLELRAPFVRRLGDGQQAPHGDRSLVGAADAQRLDRLALGPLVHG